MKTSPSNLLKFLYNFQAIAALVGAVVLVAPAAHAQTNGTWNLLTGTGNWSAPGNWVSTIADGAGATADFSSANLSGATIVTVDTSRIIGVINIGDPASTFRQYTLASSGGSTLTLNNNGTGARINLVMPSSGGTAITNLISAPLILGDSLLLDNQAPTGASTRNLNISGDISETGGSRGLTISALDNTALRAVILSGNNSFTGGVTINNGMLQLGSVGALNSVTPNAVNFAGIGAGTLRLSGNSVTVATLNAASSNAAVDNGAAGAATLTVNNSATSAFGGTLADGSAGALNLIKNGSAVLNLSGANTYTGTTTVSGGTLLLNGTSSGTGAINVANGATFGRTGTTSISLGGDLTLADGSKITLSLGAGGIHSSLARTGGTWAFDSDQAFTFLDLGGATGSYSGLITGLGADPGTIGGWTITNSGWAGTFSYNAASGGSVDLNLSAIPEPRTWALLAGSLTIVLVFRRRRTL